MPPDPDARQHSSAAGLDWRRAPCGLLAFDENGVIADANDRFCEMVDYAPGQLRGKHIDVILPIASRIFYQTHMYPMVRLNGRAEELRLSFLKSDGKEFPVLLSARRRQGPEPLIEAACLAAFEMAHFQVELILGRRRAEDALRGDAAFVALKAELARQAEALDRARYAALTRARDLESIAGALFHQLREPLRKIKLLTDAWEAGGNAADAAADAPARVRASADRMMRLLRGIQQYALPAPVVEGKSAVNLADCAKAAAKRIETTAPPGRFRLQCGDLPAVVGDRAQLELLFYSLFDNALAHRRPDAAAEVAIKATLVERNAFMVDEEHHRYESFARVVLEDNSKGFEPAAAESAFDLLARRDASHEGLSFELAHCRKIAENHHGSIELDKGYNAGARFIIYLPLKP